ncbi:phosphotransferase [Pseudogemmobacter humi]|uniref:Phosphotransferase enzyme family protein n=1 Tax=Pseudogemmobacter humi TaxID=2483812 RepID=A0A3P5X1W8_9RHOB|nr:phosphotransferase [Pseudogemmobacter humi]VDC25221.1 Phosphotransferase enzyme family protein [Pseudogemmobacter humi]
MNGNGLSHLVKDALRNRPGRISRLRSAAGGTFWLKRVEKLSLRLRLQKGDPRRAFEAEREGLKTLAAKGLPVPKILLEGPDYFLLPDAGPTLEQIAGDEARPVPDREAAFAAAGKALARLHWAGLSHGRPAPRDICWDGCTARFIDLERFSLACRSGFRQALDVVIFTQSCFSRWPRDSRWLDAALAAWSANAPDGAGKRVSRLACGLGWLGPPARALSHFRPKSRELRAVPLTLGRLRCGRFA